jgi:hypothetical protein
MLDRNIAITVVETQLKRQTARSFSGNVPAKPPAVSKGKRDLMELKYSMTRQLVSVLALLHGMAMLGTASADSRPQDVPRILSDESIRSQNFLPDFSYAGYRNGSEELPAPIGTVILVDDFGASADDDIDDTKAIRAAIARAHDTNGAVTVRFSAGRYRITGVLKIERSSIVLQGVGAGPGGTTLWFPRPLKQVDRSTSLDELRKYIVDLDKRQLEPEKNLDEYFSEYSWSGGFLWIQKPGTRAASYLE